MLKDYLASIPDYYYKFLHHFFNYRFGIEIPEANPQNRLLPLQKKLTFFRMQERQKIHQLGDENLRRHQGNSSLCCPIYSQNYKDFCRDNSKYEQSTGIMETVFKSLLGKVSEM